MRNRRGYLPGCLGVAILVVVGIALASGIHRSKPASQVTIPAITPPSVAITPPPPPVAPSPPVVTPPPVPFIPSPPAYQGAQPPSSAVPPPVVSPKATAPAPKPPAATPAPAVEIGDAVSQGLATVSITGEGTVQEVGMNATLLGPNALRLVIPVGTVFQAASAGTQSMVVVSPVERLLSTPGQPVHIPVPVACADMNLDTPSGSDQFSVKPQQASGDLAGLLGLPGFKNQTFRVQQFAIWTITDNPPPGGYVGLGSFGFGSGPSPEELQAIRSLFQQAGIDPNQYSALR